MKQIKNLLAVAIFAVAVMPTTAQVPRRTDNKKKDNEAVGVTQRMKDF